MCAPWSVAFCGTVLLLLQEEIKDLADFDVVVSSFEALCAEGVFFKKRFLWRVVIVDEGHRLFLSKRNDRSQLSQKLKQVVSKAPNYRVLRWTRQGQGGSLVFSRSSGKRMLRRFPLVSPTILLSNLRAPLRPTGTFHRTSGRRSTHRPSLSTLTYPLPAIMLAVVVVCAR